MTVGRVLVTGGAGFLGLHLTAALSARGIEVRTLDGRASDLAGPDELIGDVRDPSCVARAVDGVDAVVHAAAASPAEDAATIWSVNVGGTRVVLEAAQRAGIRRVVQISSTIVDRDLAPHPLLRAAPQSRLATYRDARVEAEALVEDHAEDLDVAVVRPKTFLGPGRVGAFAIILGRIARGEPVPVLGDGRSRYQLLHVDDLARGIADLIACRANGVFAFGAGEVGTVRDDLAALIAHAATGARLVFVPPLAARTGLRLLDMAGLAPLSEWHQLSARGVDSVIDIGRAETELGWHARYGNVETLVAAYDWYRGAGAGAAATRPVPRAHRTIDRLVTIVGRR